MWLNQQTLDAIRIMAALAAGEGTTRVADLAALTGVTVMNVHKTVHALRGAGLLTTMRGRGGGVALARPAHDVSVAQVVRALEPEDCPASFMATSDARAAALEARLSRLMFDAHRGFFAKLETTTLDFLAGDERSSP